MKRSLFLQLLLIALVIFMLPPQSMAGNPLGAYYHGSSDRLFWFMILSDSHIGTDGSQDTDNLTWAVNEAKDVIDPLFIVNTGDLTDSTNGGLIPNGPYQEEWERYRQILDAADVDTTFYFDIPGNHDAYNDENFAYYLAHSIQGSASGKTQHAWVQTFPFGRYHFLGVCTAGNDGAPFSIWPWDSFGDHAGLDEGELAFIESQLMSHHDAALTLIFGHHPFDAGYSTWIDTGLTYGLETLLGLIDDYGVSQYGFGHTHDYRENFYDNALYPGVFYLNTASLGKSGQDHYAIMAVDGNGLSVVPADKGIWPVVLITAPVDQSIGKPSNPFAYEVPQSPGNPIRALVFDKNPVVGVAFRIDEGGDWHEMEQVNDTPVWQGFWNASASIPGPHVIEVRADGSTEVTDRIETSLNPDICNGDFNKDGDVDGSDLAVFAADFGRTDCDTREECEGDFDKDDDVDGSDLAVFAADFGRTDCPGSLKIPYIKGYSNSGCLDMSDGAPEEYPGCGEDEIAARVEGNSILITHENATYNCCLDDVEVILSSQGNILTLHEKEILTTPCYCLCCYHIDTEIAGLVPGEYTTVVCWQDGETHGERCQTVHVIVP